MTIEELSRLVLEAETPQDVRAIQMALMEMSDE